MKNMAVSQTVVLIDWENVQPKDLHLLSTEACLIRIFIGRNQKNIALEVSMALQPHGASVEYVRVQHSGHNALDFLLSFYLGQLITSHPAACFWIVSKDGGFDSLVSHLRDRKIKCERVESIQKILRGQADARDLPVKVMRHLAALKGARPCTVKGLRTAIRSVCHPISDVQVDGVIRALVVAGSAIQVGRKVRFSPLEQWRDPPDCPGECSATA